MTENTMKVKEQPMPEGVPDMPEGWVYVGLGGQHLVDSKIGFIANPPDCPKWLAFGYFSGNGEWVHYAAGAQDVEMLCDQSNAEPTIK